MKTFLEDDLFFYVAVINKKQHYTFEMSTCSGLEKAKSGCTAPEQDPVLFELSKGSNPRYYQYAETKIRVDRVRQRQNFIRDCIADSKNCFMEEVTQSLTNQPTYDSNGMRTSSNLPVKMRLKNDFPAAYPEGEIEEANRIVETLRGQRLARQCDLYQTNCGNDTSQPGKDIPLLEAGAYGKVAYTSN